MVPKLRSLNWLSGELGIDRATLGKALKALSPDEVEMKGDREYRSWFTSRVYEHLIGNEELDLTAERARLTKEQADKTEMENSLKRGELLDAKETAQAWDALIHAVKTKLLSIPSQLSSYLADKNANDIEGQLSDAIYDALTELSEGSTEEPTSA